MILPTIMTLSDDALRGVPATQRKAARGLGLTLTETVFRISLPQALPGLVAAVLLGLGRALGETIAVFSGCRAPGQSSAGITTFAQTPARRGPNPDFQARRLGDLYRLWQPRALGRHGRAVSRPARFWSLDSALSGTGSPVPGVVVRRTTDRLFRLGHWFVRFGGLCAARRDWGCRSLARPARARLATLHSGGCTARFGGGDITYQLIGTLLLVVTAVLVSAPLAVGLALAEAVYLGPRASRVLRAGLYGANAIPSIVLGIVGLMVFAMILGWGKSWLAGGILLGFMILPTLTVALVERIEALPKKYVDAAYGLGMSRSQVVRTVVLPQSRNGLLVGALLGLSRAAGETAPIMFTAAVFSGATLPSGIKESPVLALPYHIFVLAQDTYDPIAHTQMWAAAFVLIALVLVLNLASLPARLKGAEEARHG